MHGKMHGRKGDLHPPPQHTQSQKKEKKTREKQNACQNHKQQQLEADEEKVLKK